MDQNEIREDVRKHCPGWQNVDPKTIKIDQMAGITNLTFKVHAEGVEPSAFIYRRFG